MSSTHQIYSDMIIHFRCEKDSGCIYKTPDNEIITKSKFEDLENTLYNLEGGLYNSEIRKLMGDPYR